MKKIKNDQLIFLIYDWSIHILLIQNNNKKTKKKRKDPAMGRFDCSLSNTFLSLNHSVINMSMK